MKRGPRAPGSREPLYEARRSGSSSGEAAGGLMTVSSQRPVSNRALAIVTSFVVRDLDITNDGSVPQAGVV
jgi:hypothetical protein